MVCVHVKSRRLYLLLSNLTGLVAGNRQEAADITTYAPRRKASFFWQRSTTLTPSRSSLTTTSTMQQVSGGRTQCGSALPSPLIQTICSSGGEENQEVARQARRQSAECFCPNKKTMLKLEKNAFHCFCPQGWSVG